MSYTLIPQPKYIELGEGGFEADMRAAVFSVGMSETPAALLAEAVYSKTSFLLAQDYKEGADNVLWVCEREPRLELGKAKEALRRAGDSREAYGLVVSGRGLAAAANTAAGLMAAAATAAQLLTPRNGRPFWPACTISDRPDLALRAVHLDLKHHMEKHDYLASLAPRLASFKINALVLELENKFLYTKRPEISAPMGLTAEDLQDLADQCREHSIELIPLVQGLGHASYILRHPKYAALREKADSFAEFCPQLDGTYEVLFDLYEEVAEATHGTRYFHIGGDEAWLMGNCPRCAEALKKQSKFSLYEMWLNRCAGKIRELGRVPMVWDDMLIKDAGEDWSKLPKDLFYVRWNYNPDAAEKNQHLLEKYAKTGLRVIVAAAIQTCPPYLPNYMNEHLPNINGFGKAAANAGLAGILTTAWEDSGNHTESFWPGYAATGAIGWNAAETIDFEFVLRFTRIFHGAADGRLAAVYRTLGNAVNPVFGLFTQFEPYKAEQTYPLPGLVPAKPGKRWRDANAERIATATRLAAELRETKKVLSAEILSGKHENSYALEVLLAANRVMLARIDLFFALRDAEIAVEEGHDAFTAGDSDRASGSLHDTAAKIYGALSSAESALSSLKSVWELTRFPQDMSLFETPDAKYVHDFNNYGHLAAKTMDLSYVIFVERHIGADALAAKLMAGAETVRAGKKWPFEG
jgi:hexosaminidase